MDHRQRRAVGLAVALTALLAVAGASLWAGAQDSSQATQWEYFTLTASSRDADFRTKLNARGDEGWELVTFVPSGDFQIYIFKRPVQ